MIRNAKERLQYFVFVVHAHVIESPIIDKIMHSIFRIVYLRLATFLRQIPQKIMVVVIMIGWVKDTMIALSQKCIEFHTVFFFLLYDHVQIPQPIFTSDSVNNFH